MTTSRTCPHSHRRPETTAGSCGVLSQTMTTMVLVLVLTILAVPLSVAAVPSHCRAASGDSSQSDGDVWCPLTAQSFVNVTSTHSGKSEYWVIRIRAPWDAVPQPDVLSLVAASLLPAADNTTMADGNERPFVFFGELLLSTDDAWAVVDALGLQHFPAVLSFHGKTARAIAPKGALQYGRVMSVPQPIAIPSSASAKQQQQLRQTILSQVPTRYVDPITTQPVDALNFVFSRKEVYQTSALRREQLALGVLSTVPSRAVVLRLDLSQPGDELYLAAASSCAAAAGGNVAVFVTEDVDVAARFQIQDPRSATVLPFPLPEDVSVPLEPLRRTSAPFRNAFELAAFVHAAAYDSGRADPTAEVVAERIQAKWTHDVATFKVKPLRKLSNQRDFFSHVEEVKVSIVILFFLRESDDFFMKGYNTAEAVAKALQLSWATTIDGKPNPLAATRDRIRFEVFWIDAEVHKAVATGFKTPSVPSVAFLYGLQDGRRGVRYVYGGKKGSDFPTSTELLSFMTSPNLMDVQGGREMFPLDLSTITFLPPDEVAAFYRSRSGKLRVSHAHPADDAMLVTDLKMYPTEDAKENTFVSQMVEGKIKFDQDAKKSGDDEAANRGGSTPKKKKVSSKKQRKLDAEKKRLEAELAEKKRLKEERMQKKAEVDERERVENLKKAKDALKKETKLRRQGGGGDTGGGSAGGSSSKGGKSSTTVDRPKFAPAKGPKNRFLQKREWETDRKRSMEARLVKDRATGTLHLNRAFEL